MASENVLSVACPELLSEWSEKNTLTPDGITYGSNKPVWWKGKCGHEWQASPKARHKGEKCPYCAGKRVLQGFNDFAGSQPALVREWDDKEIAPTEVTAGSQKKVWWRGKCGHRWQASVKNRVNGSGCPFCSGNLLLKGFNDLATTNPKVADEWSEKNLPILPTMVMANTNKKVWWKCKKGHEWRTMIATRSGGSGCPFCSGVRILRGFNDLLTLEPKLGKEWSERNRKSAADVSIRSRENVWWKCSVCSYEWKSVIVTRLHGSGCPACEKRAAEVNRKETCRERQTRQDFERNYEKNVFLYYLKENKIEVQIHNDNLIGIPIAFYLPEQRSALEITSYRDKKTKNDFRFAIVENDLCRKLGLKLIRILPRGFKGFDDCICIKQNGNTKKAFGEVLSRAFHKMDIQTDIDVLRDEKKIFEWYQMKLIEKSRE